MVDRRIWREIDACRLCGARHLLPVIDLGEQALTGRFPGRDEPDPPRAPLSVLRCTKCGLVQMKHSVELSQMFGNSYGYRSGINATMRGHLAGIAAEISARAGLGIGDAVLDIGCNDGTLLMSYTVPGLLHFGIDPAAGIFSDSYDPAL